MDRTRQHYPSPEGELLLKQPRDLKRQRSLANAEALVRAAEAKHAGHSWNAAYVGSLRRSGFTLLRITAAELAGHTDVYWAAMPEDGDDAYPFPSAIV